TKPYAPKPHGKAERSIQTALRACAYAHAYPTSQRRAEELAFWLHRYNSHRPHGGIKPQQPISRLRLSEHHLSRRPTQPRRPSPTRSARSSDHYPAGDSHRPFAPVWRLRDFFIFSG